MARYIFGERNGIYIIDLLKTVENLKKASKFLTELVGGGGTVLFVGTKKQARETIKLEATRCEMFYVNNRWLGGMLTNFQTIKKSVSRLKQLKRMEEEGTFDILPKKEVIKLNKEKEKLEKNLAGVEEMHSLPAALFVVDVKKEKIAVSEANKLEIPVVALVDTNCDPDEITFCIPGNDDAIKAIKVLCSRIADAILKGKEMARAGEKKVEDEKEEMVAALTESPSVSGKQSDEGMKPAQSDKGVKKAQRHAGTEAHRDKDTKGQSDKGVKKAQRHTGTEVQRDKDTKAQSDGGVKAQSDKGAEAQTKKV